MSSRSRIRANHCTPNPRLERGWRDQGGREPVAAATDQRPVEARVWEAKLDMLARWVRREAAFVPEDIASIARELERRCQQRRRDAFAPAVEDGLPDGDGEPRSPGPCRKCGEPRHPSTYRHVKLCLACGRLAAREVTARRRQREAAKAMAG